MDLFDGGSIDHTMFYHLNTTADELGKGAKILQRVYERLEIAQSDSDLSKNEPQNAE